MSNPQTEDGFTRIANELLDAIVQFDFSKRQYAVVLAVIRMTYGYNKKSDALSIWQIAGMTNIDRSHASKAVSELVDMGVLIKSENGRFSHGQIVPELSLNKHYKKWSTDAETAQATDAKTAPVPKQHPCQNSQQTDAETATPPVPKQHTHKDIPKDIPKDSNKPCALATRLPADWKPSESDIEFCKKERPDLQVESVADVFRDYWIAAPGVKGKKADWPATWRNWVRRQEMPKQNAPPNQFSKQSNRERYAAEAAEARRKYEQPIRDITSESEQIA
ncbi:MAG: replication protein [Sulfuriferula sp.]